ncbi:MAG TPA: sulfatase [Thermoanaerobaculia bacterium]
MVDDILAGIFGEAVFGRLGRSRRAQLLARRFFGLLALAAAGGCARPQLEPEIARHAHPRRAIPPNVVLIVLDTARADRVLADASRFTSPYLDRLARDAVVYAGAHAVAPWTLPSHMSMFTGLLPGQHGASWGAFAEPADMDLGEILAQRFSLADPSILLAERLRTLGYSTVAFSSNAWVSRRCGFAAGFDHFYEMWRERDRLERRYAALPRAFRSSQAIDLGDAGLVLLRFREHAELEHGLREPFFLFVNLIDPHYPYSPPRPWRYAHTNDTRFAEAMARVEWDEMQMVAGWRPFDLARLAPLYDAEIGYVDWAAGRLLAWLADRGYYDESLIAVTSDHGEHLGERGLFSHQLSVAEELLRVPLAIKYPGNGGAGTVVADPLVSNLDLYRTLLAAAGAGGGGPATLSLDLAAGGAGARSHLVAEYDYSTPYLRQYRKRFAAFPVAEHQVVRRVVYDRAGRHEFHERGGAVALVSAPGAAAAAAEGVLRAYLATLGERRRERRDEALDRETLERLRALGYID